MQNTIADAFYVAYMSDTEAPEKIDERLQELSQRDAQMLDDVLIALCGYSLATLDEMRKADDFSNTTKIG